MTKLIQPRSRLCNLVGVRSSHFFAPRQVVDKKHPMHSWPLGLLRLWIAQLHHDTMLGRTIGLELEEAGRDET